MISLRRIAHVSLLTRDAAEAASRWSVEFGLAERERSADRVRLACDDEPFSVELVSSEKGGLGHVAYELSRSCTLDDARRHLEECGVGWEEKEGALEVEDAEGNRVRLLGYRREDERMRFTPQARPLANPAPGHPRRLGHVNFLTANIREQLEFYTRVLGMKVTDWLGDGGVWLHIGRDHHVMALVDKGYSHFHHLAFDVVDIGQMRAALDHLGRRGRWVAWGPVRHGIGGNIASYVRIVEEECFVELYCDMEQLEDDHEVRRWPDDRFSSNTWGQLPPRSYFRFDEAAIASERESLEMLGYPLPEEVST